MNRVLIECVLISTICSMGFAESYLIRDVTVLPMTNKTSLSNRSVLIVDGQITEVAKKINDYPDNAVVIGGSGKFLMPGLWDMHVHLSGNADTALPMFLANGVTSVRDMGGNPKYLLAVRDAVASGDRVGPRIKTAGRILESDAFIERMQNRDIVEDPLQTRQGVGSPEEAEAAVAKLKASGVDFLKIRTHAGKDSHLAISQAADKAGMQLVGHADLPYKILLQTNQASYEHLPRDLMKRQSESERRVVWKEMAKRGIAITPTAVNYTHSLLLPLEEVDEAVEDTEGELDPRRKYVSDSFLLNKWREQVIDRKESLHPDFPSIFEYSFRNLREAHDEGVLILPGTDDGVVLMYSGFTLHDELQVLVDHLEVDPIDILRNATIGCAQFMGVDDTLGTIEVGKAADLVLLNGNPLKDVANSQKIDGVFAQGTYYDREGLDALLSEATATASEN